MTPPGLFFTAVKRLSSTPGYAALDNEDAREDLDFNVVTSTGV